MSTKKTFPAVLNSLHPMLEWVCSQLKETSLSDVEIRRVEIALEEAFVNIISYAYPQEEGRIELEYQFYPVESIELTIKDWGIPFNPMQQMTEVNFSASLEEREVGGLGILFIQKLMDKVEYQRLRETNILTLKKSLKTN